AFHPSPNMLCGAVRFPAMRDKAVRPLQDGACGRFPALHWHVYPWPEDPEECEVDEDCGTMPPGDSCAELYPQYEYEREQHYSRPDHEPQQCLHAPLGRVADQHEAEERGREPRTVFFPHGLISQGGEHIIAAMELGREPCQWQEQEEID